MKKILLLSMVGAGFAASALGQGYVILENAINSSANVSILNGPFTAQHAAPGTYQVALLWFNGTSFQQIGPVYQSGGSDGPGYFFGETVTVPTYAATGTFEVQGWTGNFPNIIAAEDGDAVVGQTASFTSAEGNGTITPPGTPVNLTLAHPGPGNWNGDLVLVSPEPSTIAVGGLGALAFWLFRRRKSS